MMSCTEEFGFQFRKKRVQSNTAESAEDALAIIQIDQPDLILLDMVYLVWMVSMPFPAFTSLKIFR
jgi:DNA-binding NtrC family response regulator